MRDASEMLSTVREVAKYETAKATDPWGLYCFGLLATIGDSYPACSVRAIISSCISLLKLTKNAEKPATRTTRSR